VSDAHLTLCPQCQAETFVKQVTAAGFHLRGSGWYATDFKNGSGKRSEPTAPKEADSKGTAKTEKSSAESAGAACGHGGCSACS
jgi:predicted nucleic acid-binding Zn ribbon protein